MQCIGYDEEYCESVRNNQAPQLIGGERPGTHSGCDSRFVHRQGSVNVPLIQADSAYRPCLTCSTKPPPNFFLLFLSQVINGEPATNTPPCSLDKC